MSTSTSTSPKSSTKAKTKASPKTGSDKPAAFSPMKTYSAKPLELERQWWLIDVAQFLGPDGEILPMGRIATLIANLLRGKHKPQYTPNVDSGDFVVVVNADKVRLTGQKPDQKVYRHHTGYLGHLKTVQFKHLMVDHPTRALEKAVWGMIPHNKLGHRQILKLKLFAGPEHTHQAQQPVLYPGHASNSSNSPTS